MQGILYAVGVGPGDPELMTMKAAGVIRQADVVAVPITAEGEEAELTTAWKIAAGAVPEMAEKEKLGVVFPMTLDKSAVDEAHRAGAVQIEKMLDDGKNVAFLTLGDPCVYSTIAYVEKIVKSDGYETKYISGVPSFCAAAAELGIPLSEWQEPIHIIPAVHKPGDALDLEGNYVLMKSGRSMAQVKEMLKESGRDVKMAENCTMPDQKLYRSLEEIPDTAGYFSLIIAK